MLPLDRLSWLGQGEREGVQAMIRGCLGDQVETTHVQSGDDQTLFTLLAALDNLLYSGIEKD